MVKFIRNNKWLLVILMLAAFLRMYRLDYLELFGDEIDAGYQAYTLMLTGNDYKNHFLPTYAQSFSEWRAPGLMYAMVPFIKVFGLNEWGVRLPAAFFGVLSIFGFYCLLNLIGINNKVSLWTACLLAITPWHIQYSRAAFEITLLSSELIWGIYLLIKGVKTNKKWLTAISGLVMSLGFYTYNTANVYVPLLCLMTLVYLKANKKQWLILLVAGVIFSLPIGYQILFGHAADRFGTMSIFNNKDVTSEVTSYRNKNENSIISRFFYNRYFVGGKKILFNYSNALGSNFLFKEGDVTFRHSLHQVGNLYWVMLPLIIVGLLNINKFMWWFLLISPIPSSLTIDGYNHATRLFLLVFPLTYLAATGLNKIKWKWFVIFVLIFEFGFYQYYYWNFYRSESWRWWHTGYKQAMKYINQNKGNYDLVLMDNTYEPALARYLFWNREDPKNVFGINDQMTNNIGGFSGFCLDQKTCFVNYEDKFKVENLKEKTLYLISQEREVGGDWDWSKTGPKGVNVLKTVRNYDGAPIFYLVEKSR